MNAFEERPVTRKMRFGAPIQTAICALLLLPTLALSAVSLPFSSSISGSGCTEGRNLYDNASGCDGFANGGNRTSTGCPVGSDSIVLSAANNPLGTGRGVRHYVADGKNYQGGTFSLSMTGLQTQLWIRFYIRYPSGFKWNPQNEHKLLWVSARANPGNYARLFTLSYGNSMRFWNQMNAENQVVQGQSGYGWNLFSDGNWHYVEVHLRYGANGYQAAWVDGVQVISQNLSMTNSSGGWDYIEFMTNADSPANGACVGVDIDDIAVSNTGYIGPIFGQGGSPPPTDTTPPTIYLTAPASFTSVSGTTSVSATATDNTGVAAVQFRLNGSNIGSEDTSPPYALSWDTTSISNGTYNLDAHARDIAGNTATSSAISVTVNNTLTAPTASISASPNLVSTGQSSVLTWSSSNASACSASGAWSGSKPLSGTQSVVPASTSTYSITCTGASGSTTRAATITVENPSATVFFEEGFDDANFASRGWYDITTGTLDTTERYAGSSSLRCTYAIGGTSCTAPKRHKFPESDSIYISYRVKYSPNFVGSGRLYHPHEFFILTNRDGDYAGPAFSYLTLYLESLWSTSSSGVMRAAFQDGRNIDQTKIGQNLIGVTENRGTAGCNGSPPGYTPDCYDQGNGVYVSFTLLNTPQTFTTANKNNWNQVEAYYRLNSIAEGIGQPDGVLRVWFNGILVLDRTDAILRTGANPTMKFNQMMFGPWIGDGSPVNQTFWMDDLVVASERPAPPLLRPSNLRLQ